VIHVITPKLTEDSPVFRGEWLVSPAMRVDSCSVLLVCAPPGLHGPALHTHETDQYYYILKGSLTVQLGADQFKLSQDSIVHIPAGTPHCNWNSEKEVEMHLEIFAPAPDMDRLFAPADARRIDNAIQLIRSTGELPWKDNGSHAAMKIVADRSLGSRSITILHEKFEPGAGGSTLRIHPFDKVYFVFEGTLEIAIGAKVLKAPAGSLVILPAGTVHSSRNAGPGVERHLTFQAPGPVAGAPNDILVHLAQEPA
jgi:mannose-6-phosphate isomerase-like protein (cupin superfamily)